jgi:catechol 2,3-dioxygenase-like lactoylglutathione lyase family enzyme
MTIIPIIKCSSMRTSIHFYTSVLDFDMIEPLPELRDPSFVALRRRVSLVFLSSHAGAGLHGLAISVAVPDADAVFHRFRARGLLTPGNPEAPTEVHEGPIRQTRGTTEFYLDDPDRNTIRFTEGFQFPEVNSGA